MIKVVGVRFRNAGKIYYFDPADLDITMGTHVIVETARGVEFGRVVSGVKEVAEEDVIQPLKSVIRIATEQDHGRLVLRLLRHLESSFMIKRCWHVRQRKAESARKFLRPMMRNRRTVFCILW